MSNIILLNLANVVSN